MIFRVPPCKLLMPSCAMNASSDTFDFADRHQLAHFGFLVQRRNKIGEENIDLIDFAFVKSSWANFEIARASQNIGASL